MKAQKQKDVRGSKRKQAARGVGLAAALCINALCLLVWLETIGRGSWQLALVWLLEQVEYAALSGMFLVLVTGALVFAAGRAAPGVLLGNTFFLLMAFVHRVKLDLRGDPLQFSDFAMAGEAFGVAGKLLGGVKITPEILRAFLLMAGMTPLVFWGVCVMKKKPFRRALCVAALCAACVPCLQMMAATEPGSLVVIQDDYTHRGFLIAFADRLPCFDESENALAVPQGYSREAVQAALGGSARSLMREQIYPDVLFVMSESLYDMAQHVSLSQEPMPYFRQLQQEYWGGEFLTMSYGGGTANVEYEVLTGYRSADTPGYGFNIFGGAIREDMDSVLSVLRENDYCTEAIHPNAGSFYDRQNVYQLLGFERMRFIDDLEPVPDTILNYPPDGYLFEQVIRAYEQRPKDRPWFCHTVTYQNHGGYDFDSGFTAVDVLEEMEEKDAHAVHNFVNMMRLSDDALRKLIAYFEKQERPVVIVVWGDHAPAVNQFGMELPQDPEELMAYYTTPLLIWNNFGVDFSMIPERLSAYRLGACVLAAIGMDEDAYFRYLAQADTPNLTLFSGLVERGGAFESDNALYQQEKERLQMLHYDRLLGENYGEGL